MQNSIVETLIGAAVIAVAAFFFMFAYTSTGSAPVSGYDVMAKFNRADGVNIGTGKDQVEVLVKGTSPLGNILGLLFNFLPIIIFGAILVFMMRQAQGTNSQAMSFGRSRARMFTGQKPTVTFVDVAGQEEAKQELAEVVEFLVPVEHVFDATTRRERTQGVFRATGSSRVGDVERADLADRLVEEAGIEPMPNSRSARPNCVSRSAARCCSRLSPGIQERRRSESGERIRNTESVGRLHGLPDGDECEGAENLADRK